MNSKYNLLSLFSIICYFYSIKCQDSVTVETKLGSIKGTVQDDNGHKINQFFGIPFAEPPVGDNRFGKPKPIQKYNGTVDATHRKNVCWMTSNTQQVHDQSEDCLFLNIFSENKTDTKLRPVMFWIYGGGLVWGDGYIYGNHLASYGVVTVGFNYRLSSFGFLYGNDSTAPGNVGIYDQIEALTWVHNNIEHFGGDPNQITVFGESAGSWSVSALILSPLANKLFKRAIMQSGAYYAYKNYLQYDSSYHLNDAKKFSESVGCHVGNDNKWLDCLRKVDPKKIIEHDSHKLIFGTEIFPYTPDDAVKMGKFHTGIEIMAGVSNSEGPILIPGDCGVCNQVADKLNNDSYHITKAELKANINLMFHAMGEAFVEKIYDHFISKVDETNQNLMRRSYADIIGDMVIKCPTYLFTKNIALNSAVNKVRMYELTYHTMPHGWCDKEWKGVCHGDDLNFVYGDPYGKSPDNHFSAMVIKMWTDFAKTGNPLSQPIANTQGKNVTDWPTFRATDESPVTPKIMELNPKNFGNLFVDRYSQCEGVWKEYVAV